MGPMIAPPDAHAQAYRDVAPVPPPAAVRPSAPEPPLPPLPQADTAAAIAVPSLRELVFVAPANASQPAAAAGGDHVRAVGLPVLDETFLQDFSADIGKPLTFARLAEIRRAVVLRYRAAGLPLVDVYVPEQDVTGGAVRIEVAEFRVGRVTARGNRYFSDSLLTKQMPLESGTPIYQSDVLRGLNVLNANPYRQVDVIYTPGTGPDTTDIVLQTDDRFPLRVYAGYNNDGVRDLGRDRFVAGLDYGNLFGLDQRIAYQVSASNDFFSGNPPLDGRPDRPRFIAHAMNFVMPLPWLDRIELFGAFAQSTPRLPDSFGQTGLSAQLSFRYDHVLAPLADWQQEVQLGYDFKRSNNNLEFGGVQIFDANTHVHQFTAAYDISRSDASDDTRANASIVFSPGRLDSANGDDAFDTARLGASPRYQYMQLSAQHTSALGAGFTVFARGQVQWTASTLLPSEEFSLGGDASVRGYEAYAAQGDRGWNIQTEVRAPAWTFGTNSVALQPFAFFDAGHVWNRTVQPGEINNALLASTGAGIRFLVGRYVSLRGTLGFPLKAVVPNGSKAPLAEVFVVIGN